MQRIKDYFLRHPGDQDIEATIGTDGSESLVLPREAMSLLAYILAQAATGKGVTITAINAELMARVEVETRERQTN
ncbi:hypothetical protein [Nocardia goodfellowii]|uniref:Uncharacterized protein n=1 Tax=Nocardia goodfellowii TaxID=882446 RepID=A0ABS4Q656_9NOCA|nr:hypothetical protein [Nocardia goodfellowii]MBP2187174.1 hypothetical protein [Nocardia goodfellowii]